MALACDRASTGTFGVVRAERPRVRSRGNGTQGRRHCDHGPRRLRCRASVIRTAGTAALGDYVSARLHGCVPPARRPGAWVGGHRDDRATDRAAAADPCRGSPARGHVLARGRRPIAGSVRQEHRGESHSTSPSPRTLAPRNGSRVGRQRSPPASDHEPDQQPLHLDRWKRPRNRPHRSRSRSAAREFGQSPMPLIAGLHASPPAATEELDATRRLGGDGFRQWTLCRLTRTSLTT